MDRESLEVLRRLEGLMDKTLAALQRVEDSLRGLKETKESNRIYLEEMGIEDIDALF